MQLLCVRGVPSVSTPWTMEHAVAVVTQAIQFDNAGQLRQSYEKYKEALALLLPLVKGEPDPVKKASLTETVSGYMQRAETIKQHLVQQDEERKSRTAASVALARKLAEDDVAAEAKRQQEQADEEAARKLAAEEEAEAKRRRAEARAQPRNGRQRASVSTGRVGGPPSSTTSSTAGRGRGTATSSTGTTGRDRRRSGHSPAASAAAATGTRSRTSHSSHTPARSGTSTRGRNARSPARIPARTTGGTTRAGRSPARGTTAAARRGGRAGAGGRSTGRTGRTGRTSTGSGSGTGTGTRRRGGAGTGAGAGSGAAGRRRRRGDKKEVELNEFEERVKSEVVDKSPGVEWGDIAGLKFAKQTLMEAVILPNLRPDIFTGLRAPPKGVLLFGPPGTGKTLLAKAVATESKATFFSISAAALTSKWMGEGEKLVRALFTLARKLQPTVVFIDEIDSLLSARRSNENPGSRRIKTEFLVQLDGATSEGDDKILVMGATNRPQELDDAVRRRLVKRVYIPLPDAEARGVLIRNLMKSLADTLSEQDFATVVSLTDGYSGSDLKALCAEAAMGPVRELGNRIADVAESDVRPVAVRDFVTAARVIRASVDKGMLQGYAKWNSEFGSA